MALEKRDQVWTAMKSVTFFRRNAEANKGSDQPSSYAQTPVWWYWITAVISLFLGIFCCEYWKVQLPWYGVILAYAIVAVFFVPVRSLSSTDVPQLT
jgi:cobalamin synthase